MLTTIAQPQPQATPTTPQLRAAWDWTQAGVGIAVAVWILRWLTRQTSGKSERDDRLLATAIKNQQDQNSKLIGLVAEQQSETRRALEDLRDAIESLESAFRSGLPLYRSLPNPTHLPPQGSRIP
jgi:hypothetical protein